MLKKSEIERELKFARDPEKQLEIIAELNGVKVEQVKKVLNGSADSFIITKKPGAPRKWTDAEIDRVVELYNMGYTLDAIAAEFGYSSGTPIKNALRNYVYNKRPDFVPRKQGWEKKDIEEAISMKKQGIKTSAIAQRFGRTPDCVRMMLRKHMGDCDESTYSCSRC
ncbi:MAG: hypothetical protein ACI3XQ_06545 [Eubacteriales bacterium]